MADYSVTFLNNGRHLEDFTFRRFGTVKERLDYHTERFPDDEIKAVITRRPES